VTGGGRWSCRRSCGSIRRRQHDPETRERSEQRAVERVTAADLDEGSGKLRDPAEDQARGDDDRDDGVRHSPAFSKLNMNVITANAIRHKGGVLTAVPTR
jgi:hypothetical protein